MTYAEDPLSRRASVSLPNGVVSTYGYDSADRLTSLTTTKGGATLSSVAYGYDPIANRTSSTDGVGVHALTYDPLSQLLSVTNPALSYAYDAVGNRTTAAGQTYTTNALNQYTAVGGTTHTWNANGNLTNDGTATYTWTAENRLAQVVKGATTVTFTYDALGRRASKTVNGVTTKYLYDGADLITETTSAGTVTGTYLFGARLDEPLELKRGTTTSYYSMDGLGSVVHLTNSTGAITERASYDPYGTPSLTTAAGQPLTVSAFGNPFLFTGREWDAEIGLYYYRARYSKPAIGRFISRDPMGHLGDANLYRYAENNATNGLDPSGMFVIAILPTITIIDIIIAGIVGTAVGITITDIIQRPGALFPWINWTEVFQDQSPQGVPKPKVLDPSLQALIDQLYRPGAKIGTGSTADAIRHEKQCDVLLSPKGHAQKGEDYLKALKDWLDSHPDASPEDRAAADDVVRDLEDALRRGRE